MDSETKIKLIQMLVWILIPVVIAIFSLIGFLVYLHYKEKNQGKKVSSKERAEQARAEANRQSIFKFMEFDKVEDSMIIQKNGTRYLMVINCQGVNYDLMSGVEKNSVEEGFVQFLNTLRHPVQIYIQTRAINLESSLRGYKEKVREVEDKYNRMKMRYDQMVKSGRYSNEQLSKAYFELTKESNLYEYGNSVIQDTERMSLNKNILSKNYYIIVPYYSAEIGNDKLDKGEIEGVAFSELYTRCQSIIASISVSGVRGRILKTNELVELLYMAYNREEAETFGLDKALKAGYGEMFSTAPDVYEKKIRELDKIIEERAVKKAKEKLNEAKTEIQRQAEEKENEMEDIIDEVAKMILEENEEYIGTETKELAIEKINNEKKEKTKEGGKANGKKTTRGRKKASAE